MTLRPFTDLIRRSKGQPGRNPWFWVAGGFLVLVFLTGGSSRAGVLSLPLLRPVAALLLAAALVSVRGDQVRTHRTPVLFLTAIALTMSLQLLPLPPAIWTRLPHRELAVAAVEAAGMVGEWRPLSLVPTGTRNALFSLLVPAAMLAVALHLNSNERLRLAFVVLGLGAVGIVLGVLQVSTSPSGTFFLYRLSTKFAPNGFFANPNHNAAFLATLLPMTGFAASRLVGKLGRMPKELVADLVTTLVVVLTILLAGSRAGLMLAAVGIAAMPLARAATSTPSYRLRIWPLLLAGGALAVLVGVAALAGRASALQRLFAGGVNGDLRLRVWPIIAEETGRYFPAGAGWGSFVEVFQIVEPYRLLKPTYLNHAHNDWLEVVMGGGAIGAALLAFILGWWIRSVVRLRPLERRRAAPGWLGLTVMLVLGLSSLADYPLRTPCLQALFVLAWLWVGDVLRPDSSGLRERQSVAPAPTSTGGLR